MTQWLLGTIVLLLFYKLVERRHKVVLFKVIASLGILASLLFLALYLQKQHVSRSEERQRLAVAITMLPDVPIAAAETTPKVKNPFADIFFPVAVDEVQFAVCNRFTRSTQSVQFEATGRQRGHSTPYKLDSPSEDGWRTSTTFWTDRIIAPSQCDTLTFYGKYTRYDEVTIRTISVEYLKRP